MADNGNDIINAGKSESMSKISKSLKRPHNANSKMRLEDQMGVPDDEDKSARSSRRGRHKEDYFSELSLKN